MDTAGKKAGALLAVILVMMCFATQWIFGNDNVLSVEGIKTLLLLAAFLVMLVMNVQPVLVISFLFVALMPLTGTVASLNEALSGFSNPVVFFTLASFGIAMALTEVPLSKRILAVLLRKLGHNIASVLLAMMACCCISSALVSNVPCCAVFMALSLSFLDLCENESDRRKTGRVFMIAIPVASMIGGMITPVGSSVNLIAQQQLENAGYSEISFVKWMTVGLPVAVILLPLAWIILLKVFKPVEVSEKQIIWFISSMNVSDRMENKERKVVILLSVMIILWLASSWVRFINTMIVAILGCAVLFLPGMNILTPKKFLAENSWDSFFLVATIISLSNAMNTNGVGSVLANGISNMLPSEMSSGMMAVICAIVIFVSLLIIPVATSLIPVMLPVLLAVAASRSISPQIITLAVSMCACNCYLLPLDTVTLITYGKGYYTMKDMLVCTIWLQLSLAVLCGLWIPLIV